MSDITNKDLPDNTKEVNFEIKRAEIVAPAAKIVNEYHGLAGKFVPLHVTKIIGVIAANEKMHEEVEVPDTIPFDIQQKINCNELVNWNEIIHEFGYLAAEVDKIYEEYDRIGKNTSKAVMHWLRFQIYFQLCGKYKGDNLFNQIANQVLHLVQNDPEYDDSMGLEVLTENIYILLVHAFMKCKIFKKPIATC